MQLTVKANAKINLTLDVTGTDERGYHLLDSVFQSVDIYDTLTLTTNSTGKVTVTSSDSTLSGENNITHKAATCFFKAVGKADGVEIHIEKKIPVAAGMGGGSADAAATLLALNRLYGEPLPSNALSQLALSIGADVPFCLKGGTMRATGVGERLEALPDFPCCHIVIIKDGQKPSTKEMYNRLDNVKALDRPDNAEFINALKSGDYKALCQNMKNVFGCLWEQDYIREIIAPALPDATVLSGSGPVLAAFFDEEGRAMQALRLLKDKRIQCHLCSPAKKAYSFE